MSFFFTGCGGGSDQRKIDLQENIIGEWRSFVCIPPPDGFTIQNSAYHQRGIAFTDSGYQNISYDYNDSECTEFVTEDRSSLEMYFIGDEIVSSSGIIMNEIDLYSDLGDVIFC